MADSLGLAALLRPAAHVVLCKAGPVAPRNHLNLHAYIIPHRLTDREREREREREFLCVKILLTLTLYSVLTFNISIITRVCNLTIINMLTHQRGCSLITGTMTTNTHRISRNKARWIESGTCAIWSGRNQRVCDSHDVLHVIRRTQPLHVKAHVPLTGKSRCGDIEILHRFKKYCRERESE